MPACLCMADSNLLVANDITWMDNNTILYKYFPVGILV